MSWRDRARPVIAEALRATEGMSDNAIRTRLFEVYPFGQRRHFPYKIWLDEIKRQRKRKLKPAHPDQELLFEGSGT